MKAVRKGSDFLVQLLLRHKVKVLAFLAMLWLLVIFADMIVPALAITALGIIAMFSTSYKRVIRIPPAIEMVTFTTVIVSLAYGPFVGAIYAVVTTIAAEVMTNALDIFIISFVPSRVVIALTAGLFFNTFSGNMLAVGAASTILYNLVAQPFYWFIADVEMRAKSLYFMFMNVGTNIIWFSVFGGFFVRILGIGVQ